MINISKMNAIAIPFIKQLQTLMVILFIHMAGFIIAHLTNPQVDIFTMAMMFLLGLIFIFNTFFFMCCKTAYREAIIIPSGKWEKYITKIESMFIDSRAGFVYIAQRGDGVYKIGRTSNSRRRMKEHVEIYDQGMMLIRSFLVPDMVEFEKLALEITQSYPYKEPGHIELREMTNLELEQFVTEFEKYLLAWRTYQ